MVLVWVKKVEGGNSGEAGVILSRGLGTALAPLWTQIEYLQESLLTSSQQFDRNSPKTALVSHRGSGIFYYSAPESSTFPPRVFTISPRLLRPSETTATCDQFQQSLSIELFCLPTPTQLSPQRCHTTHNYLPVAFANTLLT